MIGIRTGATGMLAIASMTTPDSDLSRQPVVEIGSNLAYSILGTSRAVFFCFSKSGAVFDLWGKALCVRGALIG